jgi:hypothetical protein
MEKRPEIGTAASAAPDASARAAARDVEGANAGTGGIGGAAGGAAAGATAGAITLGPIGALIGAIAGAVGGGWAGMSAGSAAAAEAPAEREALWRAHYDALGGHPADLSYERARPAYQLGWLASRIPDYEAGDFDAVERDLERGWNGALRERYGEWSVVRAYAREAYERERPRTRGATFADRDMGGSATHHRASYSDPIPERTDDGVFRTSEEYARRPAAPEDEERKRGERGRRA